MSNCICHLNGYEIKDATARRKMAELEDLFVLPTEEAVGKYLFEHPELTTTVQDGELTESMFSDELKIRAIKDYVTPHMFGAVGDGVTDDTEALNLAVNNVLGLPVNLCGKTYKTDQINVRNNTIVFNGYLIGESSETRSNVFFIDTEYDIRFELDNVHYTVSREHSVLTFTEDTDDKSSNVTFLHNNESNSDVVVRNCYVSGCEYAVKVSNAYGSLFIDNCKFTDCLMPIYTASVNFNIINSHIESVASYELYHAFYLYMVQETPGVYGRIENCVFKSNAEVTFQAYNPNRTDDGHKIRNIDVHNCTFLYGDDYGLALSYNDVLVNFYNCRLKVMYSGIYKNCYIAGISKPYYVRITGSEIVLKVGPSIIDKTECFKIENSSIVADGLTSYMFVLNTSTSEIRGCTIHVMVQKTIFKVLNDAKLILIGNEIKHDFTNMQLIDGNTIPTTASATILNNITNFSADKIPFDHNISGAAL